MHVAHSEHKGNLRAKETKPILDDLCLGPGNVAYGMFQNVYIW